MKKPMILLGALAAATVFAAQADEQPVSTEPAQPAAAETAEAEELEEDETSLFEVSLTLDVNSAYVSHNRIFSDTPVAQYDLWMQLNLPEDFGWLAVDVWANQELQKRHSSRNVNGGKQFGGIGEFDYEVVYGNSIGPVNFTASHLWYTYPRCGRDYPSQKFWTVGAEYDNAFVVPSVKLFWEYDRAGYSKQDCFMIDFALSRGFELAEDLTLTFTSKATLYTEGYAKALSHDADRPGEGLHRPAFGGWDNGVALSYALTDNLSLGAHLNYLYKLDHRVRHCPGWDSYSAGNDDCGTYNGILYGGVSASLSF